MNAYSEQGDYVRACEIFDKMKEAGYPARDMDYTCLLKCCAVRGLAGEAEDVFRRMLSCGVRPTRVTLAPLRRGLGKARYESLLAELHVDPSRLSIRDNVRFLTAAKDKWDNPNFHAQKDSAR